MRVRSWGLAQLPVLLLLLRLFHRPSSTLRRLLLAHRCFSSTSSRTIQPPPPLSPTNHNDCLSVFDRCLCRFASSSQTQAIAAATASWSTCSRKEEEKKKLLFTSGGRRRLTDRPKSQPNKFSFAKKVFCCLKPSTNDGGQKSTEFVE